MSLVGKLVAENLFVAPPHEFHGVWAGKPHHMSTVTPAKIQNVHLREGSWGTAGSVIEWHYAIDGKNYVAKEIVETIDNRNKAVTFKVIEGHLLQEYKSFKATIQTTPKGEATWVSWTIEYEKLNKDIPHPVKLLEFLIQLGEDLDGHLVQAN